LKIYVNQLYQSLFSCDLTISLKELEILEGTFIFPDISNSEKTSPVSYICPFGTGLVRSLIMVINGVVISSGLTSFLFLVKLLSS